MLESRTDGVRPLCILHVDDHAQNRRMVQAVLAAGGHDVAGAQSGDAALQLLAVQPFDLVLMDVNMPGMTGLEVVRRLRGSVGPARWTPVIALTSEMDRGKADYAALGFDDFVAKPFVVPDLLNAVWDCTHRPVAFLAAKTAA